MKIEISISIFSVGSGGGQLGSKFHISTHGWSIDWGRSRFDFRRTLENVPLSVLFLIKQIYRHMLRKICPNMLSIDNKSSRIG